MSPNGNVVTPERAWDDVAWVEVVGFAQRFGSEHSRLALHAAVPIGLTPELVHLLRVNFAFRAEWIAEADLLLSPLSQEVGPGLYVLRDGVRDLLRAELMDQPEYGHERVREVAAFLYAFTDRALRAESEPGLRRFLESQRWAARATLEPEATAEELAAQLRDALATQGRAGSSGVAGLIRSLAEPLFMESELVLYASGLERMARGDRIGAEERLGLLADMSVDVIVGDVELPPAEDLLPRPDKKRFARRRMRPPRVRLTYEIETGGAIEERELPFIVGVLGDFTGGGELPQLAERQFIEVTPDNFDAVLRRMLPRLSLRVENRLAAAEDEGSLLQVDLAFETFEDFSPLGVARQVAPLLKLLDHRRGLAQLRDQLRWNRRLEDVLESVRKPEVASQVAEELRALGGEDRLPVGPGAGEKTPPPLVFLSSTWEDLRHHAGRARHFLGPGNIHESLGGLPPHAGRPERAPKEVMAESDLFIALIGRSSWAPPEGGPGHVQRELELAVELGLDVFVCVLDDEAEWPEEFDTRSAEPRFVAWVQELRERFPTSVFDADSDSLRILTPVMRRWMASRARPPSEGQSQKASRGESQGESQGESLLDQLVHQVRLTGETDAREMIRTFVSDVLDGSADFSQKTGDQLEAQVAELDRLISSQLDAILHHPDFQQLESTWTGLRYLIAQTEIGVQLRVRVLSARKDELLEDVGRAPAWDRTQLFKKVYEVEFGQFGGEPYGVVLGAYAFDHSPDDVALLSAVANVASAAHAPFVARAAPSLFGFADYAQLPAPRDLEALLESSEHAAWRHLRDSEEARYVYLTVPDMLLREPYREEYLGREYPEDGYAARYVEAVDGTDDSLLWGSPAWALAARITASFADTGWLARIRGVENGGRVEGLPAVHIEAEAGDSAVKASTRVMITDRREHELASMGLVPLVHEKGTENASFRSAQSLQKAKTYDSDDASAAAHLAAQLPYLLCTSRFAHYVFVQVRDRIGTHASDKELADQLNTWLLDYVVVGSEAPGGTRAVRPLSDARADVLTTEGGRRAAVLFLKPHYQLDELSVSLRVVVELPETDMA